MEHNFQGVWITDEEFCDLLPRDVFHRQLDFRKLPCDEHRNRHILFRKTFCCDSPQDAAVYITADDYYKLYVNGRFVGQGPAPSYHFQYNYNVWDVREFLQEGENVIAVHTLYQGLINRVWQSGDNRHGLIADVVVNGAVVAATDETFKVASHTGYTETGVCGYDTQFLERYDSNAPEVGFECPDYDDSAWDCAKAKTFTDHVLVPQASAVLTFETVVPKRLSDTVFDLGSNYVGYLLATVNGKKGDRVTVRCGQELDVNGSVRFELRANCRYEEEWILGEGDSALEWFDYKSFRYVELILPPGAELCHVAMNVRHYPFTLKTDLKPAFAADECLRRVWELCVNTQKYGVQEVIQDCMEREKGFYLGDGCYTALTHMVLTGDDSMVRKLIDDAFATTFITDTLVTCMDCSFMQEIAEYPLMLVSLTWWHYRLTRDAAYLHVNYEKVKALLDAYRREYETDGLLRNLDKWCVVEWPKNFQQGYDVDITEGKVCREAHVSLNAYYLEAVRTANRMAAVLGEERYRDEAPLFDAFMRTFYRPDRHLFRDGENTEHVTFVGNVFVYGFGLCDDPAFEEDFLALLSEYTVSSLSFFCTFPLLWGFARRGREDLLREALLNDGAWRRMLREDATTTFEGWGKETKWNTSLFHLTMSYAALFMADIDVNTIW